MSSPDPTSGDLAALSALPPVEVIGTDVEPSAQPPADWDPGAHDYSDDPAVTIAEVAERPELEG